MRLGQKNGLVRQWARTGTRPRQPKDQRYQSAYLFGAICPARGTGAAVAMPFADTHAMQAHLRPHCRRRRAQLIDKPSRRSAALSPPRGPVLLMDRAGWHTTGELKLPENITPVLLPPRSPEPERMRSADRKRLAVPTPDLSVEPCLRQLRRHHRRRLRRLEPAHRQAFENNVDRHAGMGTQRSNSMTTGIRHGGRGSAW